MTKTMHNMNMFEFKIHFSGVRRVWRYQRGDQKSVYQRTDNIMANYNRDKRTNNDLLQIIQKAKAPGTRTPQKHGGTPERYVVPALLVSLVLQIRYHAHFEWSISLITWRLVISKTVTLVSVLRCNGKTCFVRCQLKPKEFEESKGVIRNRNRTDKTVAKRRKNNISTTVLLFQWSIKLSSVLV